jgi:hypothetical protein
VTDKEPHAESFEAFKNSFYYGSRTDLSFKFLASLSSEDAARFFQDLLWKLGECFDDGQYGRLLEHVDAWQVRGYAKPGSFAYDDRPFTPLRKPVSRSRLALLTGTGHFVEGHDPEPFGVPNMTQAEAAARINEFLKAAPVLTAIPMDTPRDRLRVRHGGYDIRAAQADPNVVFPLERLRELEREGAIGELAPHAYSFVGATSQLRLLKETGPEWAALLREQAVDAALLVPG